MQSPERLLDSRLSIIANAYSAGAQNGAAIDMRSAEYVVVVPIVGALTSASVVVKLQESDDGSTGWTDIEGATQSITTPNVAQAYGLVRLHGRKRYTRAVATVTGTSASIGVALIRFGYQYDQDFAVPFAYSV